MKNVGLLLTKFLAVLSAFTAFALTTWPCAFIFHQPEEPEELRRLREH